jgi:glycosyltransferase involved in cell wall biosynthesis
MIDSKKLDKIDFVFNAISIKTGGGLQKTRSLLSLLRNGETYISEERILWIVTDDTPLAFECSALGCNVVKVKNTRFARFLYEFAMPLKLNKGTVIFNLGGTALLLSVFRQINVSECAYSNLFYPELRFWKWEGVVGRIRKAYVDSLRIIMVAISDVVILQTPAIYGKALSIFPEDNLRIVPAAPSAVIKPENVDIDYLDTLRNRFGGKFIFLFACGEQKNKRIQNLPNLAAKLSEDFPGFDFLFVVTIFDSCETALDIVNNAKNLGVMSFFDFVGPHSDSKYCSLLEASDAVCNFAVLESFSNNFLEAWSFGKPLITTDAEWARSAADEAAVYVDLDQTACCAEQLFHIANQSVYRDYCQRGFEQLNKYPSPEDKARMYLDILRRIPTKRGAFRRMISVLYWLFKFWSGKFMRGYIA